MNPVRPRCAYNCVLQGEKSSELFKESLMGRKGGLTG